MAPVSQFLLDMWLYLLKSEEIKRYLNTKTKLRSHQLCSLGPVQVPRCSWKGREGAQVRPSSSWKETGFTRSSWEKCQFLESTGLHRAASWVLLFSSRRNLCIRAEGTGESAPYQRCVPKWRGASCPLEGTCPCAVPCSVLVL